jgi:hypothetical protein
MDVQRSLWDEGLAAEDIARALDMVTAERRNAYRDRIRKGELEDIETYKRAWGKDMRRWTKVASRRKASK